MTELGTRRALACAAGVAAAAAAIGAGELVAAVLHPSASPLLSVGSFVIDLTPGFLKETVIRAFGTGDKPFLLIVLLVLLLVLGAVAGLLELRRAPLGRVLIVVVGLVAAGAAATRHGASVVDVTPSLVDLVVGVFVLALLVGRLRPRAAGEAGPTRRGLVIATVVTAAAGALAGWGASAATAGSRRVASAIARVRLPKPVATVEPLPAGVSVGVPGVAPFLTPTADFYRIDISLSPPQVDPSSWQLEVTGEVEQPFRITYAELLAMGLSESRTTLMCVSNEVGGGLISTATWLGVPIRDLLARARPKAGADMVLSTGADGFTASSPLSALTDGRNAILAVGMNGEVLPNLHGFPVRMVVPGLYGYVSATKWLQSLQVTRYSEATAYWTNRGWSEKGPVKVSSRIDVPGRSVAPGVVAVAGVAWAQHTGIARVQLQIDDGPWRDCELGTEASIDVWRQWKYRWIAERGTHTLRVRATDRNGLVQTAKVADVVPDGATGLHTVQVQVG
ncbi:MAG TPA: molybdopterin-dependent oxidoreductase [Amnibacterium sp.]|uniref:molybdopterin-dependent oxidoreductase n=1 Tax=Amnibacterium sp. TaxID=1872496 RepID=UPI002F945601